MIEKKLLERRAKWTGGMAQAIDHLLYKGKALSLNPSPTRKKTQ
jgi:hypothetical protein